MKENINHEDLIDCHDELTFHASEVRALLRALKKELLLDACHWKTGAEAPVEPETRSDIHALINIAIGSVDKGLQGIEQYSQVIKEAEEDSSTQFSLRRALTILDEAVDSYLKIKEILFLGMDITSGGDAVLSSLSDPIDQALDLFGKIDARIEQIDSVRVNVFRKND